MSSDELKVLLQVLDERGTGLDHDDVTSAFNGPEQIEARQWVHEYLSPATLLTREELDFFEKHRLASANPVVWAGRPLTDVEIETAITSLEVSTESLAKQCQLLEAQKRSLLELVSRHASDSESERAQVQRTKDLAREQAQLDLEIDQLSESLQSRFRASNTQVDATTAGLPSGIERVLEKDDRLLDGLESLLPRLASGNSDQDILTEVEGLCQALIQLSGREVKARLDTAYQAAAHGHSSQANGQTRDAVSDGLSTQRDSLRAELDGLTGEIDGLITMAVDIQFRVPISRSVRAGQAETEMERAQWSEYLTTTLQYLFLRSESLVEHVDHLHAHQNALQHISSALDSTMTTRERKTQRPGQPMSPTPSSQKGLKPLRLVQANLSEPQDPTAQLLRHFDIRVSDPHDTVKLAEVLHQTLAERQKRLTHLSQSTEHNVADQLAETLSKADHDVQDLLATVYAPSKSSSIKLVEEEIQGGLDLLELKTQALGDEMRQLSLDSITKSMQSKQEIITTT